MKNLERKVANHTIKTWLVSAGFMIIMAGIIYAGFQPKKSIDFNTYYLAAVSPSTGLNIYNYPQIFNHDFAETYQISSFGRIYYYPPLTAQLVWPLTFIPAETAAYLWLLLSLSAFLISLIAIKYSLKHEISWNQILAFAVFFLPLYITLFSGQVNVFLFMLLCISIYLIEQNRAIFPGILLAMAALIKYITVAHIAYLLIKQKWIAVLSAMIAFCFVFFSALPWIGWEGYHDFYTTFVRMMGTNYAGDSNNLSADRILDCISRDWTPFIRKIFTVVIALVTFWICSKSNPKVNICTLELSLVTLSIMLVLPILWYHMYLILLLPILVIYCYSLNHTGYRFEKLAALISFFVINVFGMVRYTRISTLLFDSKQGSMIFDFAPYTCILFLWLILIRMIYQFNTRNPQKPDAILN